MARRAFAIATRCISALGDYPVVTVWVNDPEDSHGLALLRDRPYVKRDTREYRQALRDDSRWRDAS